jgi:predicted TIM-barrel fold metal-dependent hydrolase
MDGMWDMYAPEADVELSMKPSDYVRRQAYVAAECDEDAVQYLVDYGLLDNLVFTTDYPHHDSPYPEGVSSFLRQPISDEAKRQILWDNAQQLFRRTSIAVGV